MTHAIAMELFEIFKETDEQNPITAGQIIEKLRERSIEVCPRTVYTCICDLRDAGYPIETCRCRKQGYFYKGHMLSMPDAIKLVELVLSAEDVSVRDRANLISQIKKLTSPSAAKAIGKKVLSEHSSLRQSAKIDV